MKKNLTFPTLIILCLMVSCRNSDVPTDNETINFIPTVSSRAAMESGFNPNDSIGIFMVLRTDASTHASFTSDTGNWIDNGKYTYNSGGSWITSTTAYWKDGESVFDVFAYYPYETMSSGTDITNCPITLDTDQSSISKLRINDFLYATADGVSYDTNSSGIPLTMKHKFCKIDVTLDLGTISASDIVVSIRNVAYKGSFNLATGTVSASLTTTSSITAYYSDTDKKAECIVLPQTIAANTDLVYVTYTDSNSEQKRLAYTLGNDLTLESGKEYTIAFTYSGANKVKSSLIIKNLNK